MPFARPTLPTLITRIRGDFRGRLEIAGSLVRRAMIDVLGPVWAGAVHELHSFLAWLAKQLFADTAEGESLLRIAELYDIKPTPAQYATGNAIATGTNGAAILAGTILRLDAATTYRVTTGATIAAGTATVPVTAVLAGAAGNLPAGATLTLEGPIAGVSSVLTVAAGGITGGVEMEDIEEVRDRLLLRLQEPPEGGADQDYEGWALAVAGVTRAWVYPLENGLGTVVVRFVLDGATNIFPTSADVARVQAALEAERPITAEVTAVAPTQLAIPFTVHVVPDNADTRAAIAVQLGELLRRLAEPGDGAGRGRVLLSQIRTAIGVAQGVVDYTLTVPSADVVPGLGQLPVVGAITWV